MSLLNRASEHNVEMRSMTVSTPLAGVKCPVRRLFGYPVHALTMDEVLSYVDMTIKRKSGLLIGVVNAAKIVNMRRNPVLRNAPVTIGSDSGRRNKCRVGITYTGTITT